MDPASSAPTVPQRPIEHGLFTWPDREPHLIGSRCGNCGTVVFPTQHGCPRCTGEDMRDILLPRRGTLWTFTTQSFAVKWPYLGPSDADFVPYTVGYVQLDDVVKVEARLTEPDPARLEIGMEMELDVVPFATDEDGTEVLTYAFRPVAESAGGGSG